MSGHTIIAEIVLKWEIALHMISCLVILINIVSIGFRVCPKCSMHHPQSIVMYILLYVCMQFPLSLTFLEYVTAGIIPPEPVLDNAIPIMFGSILPLSAIWLYISHAAKSCTSCLISVPRKNIQTLPKYAGVTQFVATGILSTFFIHKFIRICVHNADLIILILSICAAIGCIIETLYIRAHYNRIKLASSTWAWFLGTWVGVVLLSLI